MRLPRMTTRRWLIAVALISIGLGGYVRVRRWKLKTLHDEYAARAEQHAKIAGHYRRIARPASEVHHANLARTYAAAASRLWSPVGAETRGPK
jgi:hypothetical protein